MGGLLKGSPFISMHSNTPVPSNEEHQVHELDQLVKAGNWDAVMAHANRIDGALTDVGGERSHQSMSDNSMRLTDLAPQPSLVSSLGSSGRDIGDIGDILDIVTEIAELVEKVAPDELENLDEMLLQFGGREEDLVKTLRGMRDEKEGQYECYRQLSSASSVLERNSIGHEESASSIFESNSIGPE